MAQTDSPMQMIFALAEVPDDRIDVYFKRPLEGVDTPDPHVVFVTFYSPRQGIPHRVATNHYRFAQIRPIPVRQHHRAPVRAEV